MLKNLTSTHLRTFVVLCLSTMLACSTSRSGSQNPSEPARPAANANSSNSIKVHLHGLMVFHQMGNQYEVGILSEAAAIGHKFTIAVDPDPKVKPTDTLTRRLKSLGNAWELVVVNQGATVNQAVGSRGSGLSARTPANETDANKDFFDWIIDLESSAFHPRKLTLRPGLLTPIIRVSAGGELFTEAKSDELLRCQGKNCLSKGSFSDFGFIAEIVTLEVTLRTGEELVLRVTGSTGPEGEAFRLPAGALHDVYIVNGPDHSHPKQADRSHFTFYYNLFSDVTDPEQYDVKTKNKGAKPRNPFFEAVEEKFRSLAAFSVIDYDMLTVDDTTCGGVRLSLRDTPLADQPATVAAKH